LAKPKPNPNSAPVSALTYKTRDLATLAASCERFHPQSSAPKGRMHTTGKVTAKHTNESKDEFSISFETKVIGTAEGEDVAFVASCKVEYTVLFSSPQPEELPMPLLRELLTPLFHLATERCRTLISSMGYQVGNPSTTLPEFAPVDNAESESEPTEKPKRRSRTKSIASSEKT
jgi:hypothetical protein